MSTASTTQPSDQQVLLNLRTRPLLSYAMAHNRIQVVDALALVNRGPQLRGATLRLQLSDAEGPIGAPHEITIDLPAGESAVYRDIRMTLDPAAMLQVEEQRPGVVRASVVVDGEELGHKERPVQVLAAHQWLALQSDGVAEQLSLEMLAAHVMPNHPAIAPLLSEVADRLGASTGSPSVQGYQAGAERVDEIVRCVYEAMQARGIRYSEPPPSWSDYGQKVRTPGEVLEGRVGTCLDTVVVMAAALEHAGVHPLLFLVKGHIFLGYWREERSLGNAAQTEVDDVVNYVDLGLIGLVETTMLTASDDPKPFAASQRPPYATYLTGDMSAVLGVTDVHQARRDGVHPLPARTRADDGSVTVTTYSPAAHSTPPAAAGRHRAPQPAPDGRGDLVPARVGQWKNALLDLSLRNRLINFTDRARLSLAVPDAHLGDLENAVHEDVPIRLMPSDDVAAVHAERGVGFGRDLPQDQLAELLLSRHAVFADATRQRYDTVLRGLAHKARTITEETGANNLYLALGSLVWSLDDRPLRSPLVLVPVTLKATGRGAAYQMVLDQSGMSTPNFCLLEKLRQVHGLEIPGLAEPESDGAGIDLDAALTAVRVAVASKGLPFRVEPTADLSILQFAKFRLWKDLNENWEALTGNALVQHLVSTPTEPFADPVPDPGDADLDELAARCPVPADASAAHRRRRRRRRPDVRPRGAARDGQVADDHQPADAGCRRRQARALRRGEARGARRREPPPARRRHGRLLPRPARQGEPPQAGAQADQARPQHALTVVAHAACG